MRSSASELRAEELSLEQAVLVKRKSVDPLNANEQDNRIQGIFCAYLSNLFVKLEVHYQFFMYNTVMKVTVLLDNNSRIDNYLLSEPALSLYIEVEGKKILFDCGYSNVFIKNAKSLGIDLDNISDIVISHGHNDHTGGLVFLPENKNINLVAHPNIFDKKFDINNIEYGCPITLEELRNKYNLVLTRQPYWLTDNLCYLGEIENNTSLDIDDSALVYKSSKGLVIIVGCSHAGIINIIKYAQKVTECEKIYTILGGMHLLNMPQDELLSVIQELRSVNINIIYPCHCCDLYSKIQLSKYLQVEEVCSGDSYEFV